MLQMSAAGSSHLLATAETSPGDMQASAASRALLCVGITIVGVIAASAGLSTVQSKGRVTAEIKGGSGHKKMQGQPKG